MAAYIITGTTGYLGSALAEYLLNEKHTVHSLTRTPHPLYKSHTHFFEHSIEAPLSELESSLKSIAPKGIIHAAAVASAAVCENNPTLAEEGNVQLTEQMVSLARKQNIPLLTVSTDLVFDGAAAPQGGFSEKDTVCPASVYSKTKYAAEEITRAYNQGIVVRISLLYGPAYGEKKGPMGWMFQSFQEKKPLVLFTDEWRTPIYVRDAARSLKETLDKKLYGTFHLGGPTRLNRVQWGHILAEAGHFEHSLIQEKMRDEVHSIPPRAEDVSLHSEKLYAHLSKKPSEMNEVLKEILTNYQVQP